MFGIFHWQHKLVILPRLSYFIELFKVSFWPTSIFPQPFIHSTKISDYLPCDGPFIVTRIPEGGKKQQQRASLLEDSIQQDFTDHQQASKWKVLDNDTSNIKKCCGRGHVNLCFYVDVIVFWMSMFSSWYFICYLNFLFYWKN